MKTPREILFKRHEAIEPRLDAIRRQALAECVRPRREPLPAGNVFAKLWRELIWPSRRIWAGLAAVWVGIAAFNLATGEKAEMAASDAPPRTAEVKTVLKEQRQMMAQLLGATGPAMISRPKDSGPRSEQRQTLAMA